MECLIKLGGHWAGLDSVLWEVLFDIFFILCDFLVHHDSCS